MDIVDHNILRKRALFEYDSSLGRTLRSLREERGLNQEDIARVVGRHQSLISKIEAGQRSLHYADVVLYAQAFNMTIDELTEVLNEALRTTVIPT